MTVDQRPHTAAREVLRWRAIGAHSGSARRGTRGSRRRPWRLALGVVAAVAAVSGVLTVGFGTAEYRRLSGNLRSVPLYAGATGNAGTEQVDAFGDAPINLLVIGSDTRDNAADCAIGHDCGPGANADVEMLVHIAADRSSATVMSIPRDTVTRLPACRDPRTGAVTAAGYGQINATLTAGPGCTVAAVHALTGVPIDHFAMVDFAGVISMSDAIGGTPVCVSANVYDTYSHLKLSMGDHVLKGAAALAFLRSRHAFGDGSDLGRTGVQHQFLASMLRTVKDAGSFADPTRMLALAEAASKALTVDTGLGSIPELLGLAADLNKVPTDRITLVTMPTAPDPADPNRVVPGAAAPALFQAIAEDRALATRASPSGPSTASSEASSSSATSPGTAAASTSGSTPPADAQPLSAAETTSCAAVSTARAVRLDGALLTPTQAYDRATSVPDSA